MATMDELTKAANASTNTGLSATDKITGNVANSTTTATTPAQTTATTTATTPTATASNVDQANANANTNGILSNEQRIQQINNMYDSYINQQKANLESSYQTNLANAQLAKQNIDTQYNEQKNQLAAQNERTQRNLSQQFMASGLNTGAGGQMRLAQNANYLSEGAKLAQAQAQAHTTADTNINNLTLEYQQSVNEAIAKNDYNRAAALLDEYNNQRSQMNDDAKILANYGDFSGYAKLYGEDTANQMAYTWQLQNPQLAYTMGKISADEYYKMVGSYPYGYNAGTSYSGGGSTGYTPAVTDNSTNSSTNATTNSGVYNVVTGRTYNGAQDAYTKATYDVYDNSTNQKIGSGQVYNGATATAAQKQAAQDLKMALGLTGGVYNTKVK